MLSAAREIVGDFICNFVCVPVREVDDAGAMVSKENRTGLYVILPLYFCMMIAIGGYAYRRMRRNAAAPGGSDEITLHFLAGRSLNTFVTAATLFASLFSGYTVVGVPNEAYATGWVALKWVASIFAITFGYMAVGPRMRKASLVRNHQSPCDLVTDRYRSQILRYTVFCLQLLASWLYLCAQLVAIKDTFNSMFGLDPSDPTATVLIAVLILLLEWVGGLTCVAYTDSTQGCLMIIGFFLLAFTLTSMRGWNDLDPETYPKPKFYQARTMN